MKYVFLLATIVLQFLLLFALKLFDNFYLIIGIFVLCLIIGGIANFSNAAANSTAKRIGWGLFYGSLITLGLLAIFIAWLSFNFAK